MLFPVGPVGNPTLHLPTIAVQNPIIVLAVQAPAPLTEHIRFAQVTVGLAVGLSVGVMLGLAVGL